MTSQQETAAVFDAIHEAKIAAPEIVDTDTFGVKDSAFAEAMGGIPDEHHARGNSPEDRFVASVIANANARAAERSPYTVACFALDIS